MSTSLKAWPTVTEVEQVIFDLRSTAEKEAIRTSQSLNTFKQECDLWEERPQLISCEEAKQGEGEWFPVIYHLAAYQQVVHVTIDAEDPTRAAFTFC